MWKAFVEADDQAVANLVVRGTDSRMILVDDNDWYKGWDVIRTLMAQRAEAGGVIAFEFERFEAYEHESTGWWATSIVVTLASGEKQINRQTGVLVIEEGMWRIAQFHTSMGVPDEIVFGKEHSEALAGLVSSLGSETVEAVAAASRHGTVTIMFTDIEDSTVISESLGDAAWLKLVNQHFSEVRQVSSKFGGRVIKTLGDGAMIAFPGVVDAVKAAIVLQTNNKQGSFRIRIGIHTGDAMMSSGDYAGITVNKAARITAVATGGEILISSVTAEMLASRNFVFGDDRTVKLKGLVGTHRLIEIVWQ